jgi:hypothetical protein
MHAATPVLWLDSGGQGLVTDVLIPMDVEPVKTWYVPGPRGCARIDGIENDRAIAAERVPVDAFAKVSARTE